MNIKSVIKFFVSKQFKEKYRNFKKTQYAKRIVGDNVFCAICKSTFKFFGPGGMNLRPNARCHKCQSLERHRLLYLYMDQKLGFFKQRNNIRLLHFAPEKVYYDIFSKMKNVDYVPCDLLPEIYNYKGLPTIVKVDMTDIQYPDNSFDFILHNQVLEHIPNDKLAMRELFRVMKTQGSGIFQVPIDYSRAVTYEDFSITSPEGRQKAFGQHDHVRWYGRDYKNRLENSGFVVREDHFINKFSDIELKKYGLTPDELIYYCKKTFKND